MRCRHNLVQRKKWRIRARFGRIDIQARARHSPIEQGVRESNFVQHAADEAAITNTEIVGLAKTAQNIGDVVDIILLNSRTPEERVGDLNAQFAANNVGAKSVLQLFERYGLKETQAAIAGYLDFTEKRFRAAIERLPAGR